MARGHQQLEHLLRRAGFGASIDDLTRYQDLSVSVVADFLLNPDMDDDPDRHIGEAGYVSVSTRGAFSPNTTIEDARQRWLFRMVHTPNPLVEKMALFWHNHFATAYSKVAAFGGALQGTRMMAGKPGQVEGPPGQIELFRQRGLGNFRDLLLAVARDPAMLVWLDGRTNTRQRPQENFGREIMELFTFGIGNFTEEDVYAAARVFTGWNLQAVGDLRSAGYYDFIYRAAQHDTAEKTFTFPIYRDGNRTIPARSAEEGQQDGVDSSPRWRCIQTRRGGWPGSSGTSSSARRRRPIRRSSRSWRRFTFRTTRRSSRCSVTSCARHGSSIRRTTSHATPGRSNT